MLARAYMPTKSMLPLTACTRCVASYMPSPNTVAADAPVWVPPQGKTLSGEGGGAEMKEATQRLTNQRHGLVMKQSLHGNPSDTLPHLTLSVASGLGRSLLKLIRVLPQYLLLMAANVFRGVSMPATNSAVPTTTCHFLYLGQLAASLLFIWKRQMCLCILWCCSCSCHHSTLQ